MPQPKKGQELTDDLKHELKALSKQLKKHLVELEDITQDKFNELAASVVEEYHKGKNLTNEAKLALTAALQDTWTEMQEIYEESKEQN